MHGSGNLVRWLLDNDLVDEITLLTYPVVVGQGTRLFPDTGPDRALELVESRATPSGVTIQVYRPDRAPAVRNGHARREGCDIDTSSEGRYDRERPTDPVPWGRQRRRRLDAMTDPLPGAAASGLQSVRVGRRHGPSSTSSTSGSSALARKCSRRTSETIRRGKTVKETKDEEADVCC